MHTLRKYFSAKSIFATCRYFQEPSFISFSVKFICKYNVCIQTKFRSTAWLQTSGSRKNLFELLNQKSRSDCNLLQTKFTALYDNE